MTQKVFGSFAELAAANGIVSETAAVDAALDLKELVMSDKAPDGVKKEGLSDEAVRFLSSPEMAVEIRRKASSAAYRIKRMQANPQNNYADVISEPDLPDDFASRVKSVILTAMTYGMVKVPSRRGTIEKLRGMTDDFWKQKYHKVVRRAMDEFFATPVPFKGNGVNAKNAKAMRDLCENDAVKLAAVEKQIAASKSECSLQRAIGRLNSSMWLAENRPKRVGGSKYAVAMLLPEGYDQSVEPKRLQQIFRDCPEIIEFVIARSGLSKSEANVIAGVQMGLSNQKNAEENGTTVELVCARKSSVPCTPENGHIKTD